MARIGRISITFCALLFTILPFTPMAHASKQTKTTPTDSHTIKTVGKKKSATTSQKTIKTNKKTATKTISKTSTRTASSSKKRIATPAKSTRTTDRRGKTTIVQTTAVTWMEECTPHEDHRPRYVKMKTTAPTTLAGAHKMKVQKTTKIAMSTLMNQISKPYRWSGSSPRTGFDCSSLVYYAYRDLMKLHIPRTMDRMYHLHDAAPIERSELKDDDLVFFRTQGHGTAGHVSVYVGNGKSIQSPRNGQEIQITSLSEDY